MRNCREPPGCPRCDTLWRTDVNIDVEDNKGGTQLSVHTDIQFKPYPAAADKPTGCTVEGKLHVPKVGGPGSGWRRGLQRRANCCACLYCAGRG